MVVLLLLLRGHLLRVLRLWLIVLSILLRRTIHGLLWLIALLIRLILLLCWLPIRLVWLLVGRLLGRLVIGRLLLLWLLRTGMLHIRADG